MERMRVRSLCRAPSTFFDPPPRKTFSRMTSGPLVSKTCSTRAISFMCILPTSQMSSRPPSDCISSELPILTHCATPVAPSQVPANRKPRRALSSTPWSKTGPGPVSLSSDRNLIRTSDPNSLRDTGRAISGTRKPKAAPRTLLNSVVKDWSWPCILVFVTQWQTLDDLRSKPEQVIPPFVYMADGRMVPICVVLAESSSLPPRTVDFSRFTSNSIGIGYPLYVDAQGMRRMGTAACMVSDGSDFYMLTNTPLATD